MIILVTFLFTPFLIPLQFIKHFFIAIGQSEEVSDAAATYIRVVSPFIIIYAQGKCYTEYANMQGKPQYQLYSTIIATAVHLYLVYYLALDLDMRMHGVAISTGIHFFLRSFFAILFCTFDKNLRRCEISLYNSASHKDLGPLALIGWQTFLVRIMGWWAFDVITYIAAFSGDTNTAAQSILRNVGDLTFMIPVGI